MDAHILKFIYRSVLFLAAAIIYIIGKIKGIDLFAYILENLTWLVIIVWAEFVIEMILRIFFPSSLESHGAQKHLKSKYIPSGYKMKPLLTPGSVVIVIAVIWLLGNGIFGVLYLTHTIDYGLMILLSLAYSVCDVICILFFCPFQTWGMKNKCCGTCRIYNWDYAMMFTPFLFVWHPLSAVLIGIALVLLAQWEITVYRHPERFSEMTNKALECKNCPEKLCQHKKQIQRFIKYNANINNLYDLIYRDQDITEEPDD